MPSTPSVVTRFAPSPTGFLHIGGARTALFNFVFARKHGGHFLLRIEDTDRARHNEAAVKAILDGLSWLGLDWDKEPVSQHERMQAHVEAAYRLLDSGHAYRCYASAEDIEAMRVAAKEEGRAVVYDRRWRDADPSQAPSDRQAVIRFRQPLEGNQVVEDAVYGRIETPRSSMEDFILLRADGSPTYNLAVVVDDHDMGITHVIRGDDHLANTPKQSALYEAFGWEPPVFAHVPLIHGEDGKKLSKRHGAVGVEAYRDLGYLPEALRAYLLTLGWSPGAEDEILDTVEAAPRFTLEAISKSPARLDTDRLNHINKQFMAAADPDRLLNLAERFASHSLDETTRQTLRSHASVFAERAVTLPDFWTAAEFALIERPLEMSKKAEKALRKDGTAERLTAVHDALAKLSQWDETRLEETVRDLAEARGEGMGQVGPPVRAALTGGRPGPDLGTTMAVLGRKETLARLKDQIEAMHG